MQITNEKILTQEIEKILAIAKFAPRTWGIIQGIEILDPDGWRKDGQSFDTPITRAEWEDRKAISTIRPFLVDKVKFKS